MPSTLLFCLFLFFIFSFLGWVMEVAFHAVKTGKFINRGFDYGPVCPIYGYGSVLLYLCLNGLRDKWILLFLAAVFLTSALEFLTGFVLDKLFHTRWWDYSRNRLNIGGYICLEFSLIWGVLCMLLVKLLFPLLELLYGLIPVYVILLAEGVFLAIHIADTVVSVIAAVGFSKDLAALNKMSAALRNGSDKIGQGVYKTTVKAETQYREFVDKVSVFRRRIIDAFPSMKSTKYGEQLLKLREAVVARVGRKKKTDPVGPTKIPESEISENAENDN